MDVPQIHADDLSGLADTLFGDLGPASGTGSEVHHGVPFPEDPEAVVDLEQFKGCPGTVVHFFGKTIVILPAAFRDPTVMKV